MALDTVDADQAGRRQMLERIRGHQLAAMLHSAAWLELSDRIDPGDVTIEDLSAMVGVSARPLRRLLRGLAAHGVFDLSSGDIVRNNAQSRWLSRTTPGSLQAAAKYWSLPVCWTAWGDLRDALREDRNSFEVRHSQSFFSYLDENPAESQVFDQFMSASPDDRHAAVVAALALDDGVLVVDVGGGDGTLLAAILDANPSVRGLLVDRPAVIAQPHQRLGRFNSRCTALAGDFQKEVPVGDVYILSQIVHDWNDEEVTQLFQNCVDAMNPGGRVVVVERRMGSISEPGDTLNYLSDLEMLTLLPGWERTDEEYAALAEASGLKLTRITGTASPFALFELCKPA
jgi:precorrin-6B methylase 2